MKREVLAPRSALHRTPVDVPLVIGAPVLALMMFAVGLQLGRTDSDLAGRCGSSDGASLPATRQAQPGEVTYTPSINALTSDGHADGHAELSLLSITNADILTISGNDHTFCTEPEPCRGNLTISDGATANLLTIGLCHEHGCEPWPNDTHTFYATDGDSFREVFGP